MLTVSALLLLAVLSVNAQTPTDPILIPTKNLSAQITYEHGSFKKYWEGRMLTENGNFGTMVRTVVQPIIGFGITNKLNIFASIPFIQMHAKEPNGGHLDDTYGLQDLSVALKYHILNKMVNTNELNILSTLGFSFKPSKYFPDMGFHSLGLGAPELSIRGIASYKLKSNTYFRAGAGYLYRGKTKTTVDTYFYKDEIIYSSKMYVPDAIVFDAGAGLWMLKNKLNLEFNYNGLMSLHGDDIRYYSAPKPSNRINFDRLEVSGKYFISEVVGITGHYNTIVHGLNTPMLHAYGGGLIFKFKAY